MLISLLDLRGTKLLLCTFVILIYVVAYSDLTLVFYKFPITPQNMKKHQDLVKKYYDARKDWVTSNLGEYVFKNTNASNTPESYADIRKPGRSFFYVLIWRHWPWLRRRHAETYGRNIYDPLSDCSVTNCKFTEYEDPDDIKLVDAVVVNIQKGVLPSFKRRDPKQLWIFWTDEPQTHTFSLTANPLSLKHLTNLFNWSMMFRSDSDIPVPYGRTLPLPHPKRNEITEEDLKELVPFWKEKRRDVLAANVMSRCYIFRTDLLKRLQRFMSIDTFGKCSTIEIDKRRCPRHYQADCPVIAEYLFYIVIENSNCRQYISEKIYHHAYAKGAIPIIAGAPLEDCIKLLPPNSFLHLNNFKSLKALAKEVDRIGNNNTSLLSYHAWRNHFEVLEEHGFLGTRSFALCRICEALNYNDMRQKEYRINDIRLYLDPGVCCKNAL